jgi:hypothetical protein
MKSMKQYNLRGCSVDITEEEEGITKYGVAVALGDKICILSFICIGSCIQYQCYNLNNLADCNIDMTDGRKL